MASGLLSSAIFVDSSAVAGFIEHASVVAKSTCLDRLQNRELIAVSLVNQ